MKNILVYDVAAESGGALSVLEFYYNHHKNDKKNNYYYLLSTHKMPDYDNIKVLNYPYIKKSWFHRIAFDLFITPSIIKKYNIDKVLSLQNTVIPTFKGVQTVYMHNILPFAEYRFSFFEDKKMWIYQNIIGKVIIDSIKRASHVIVQAEWIKKSIERKVPESIGKIEVQFPDIYAPKEIHFSTQRCRRFFYPANGSVFKNHKVIIEAAQLLIKQGINDFEIVFTLSGKESKYTNQLKQLTREEKLPVKWVGMLSQDNVFKAYSKTVLLFPSYIETIGLPLYEAKIIGAPIIAADLKYAHDVLQDYKNVDYFTYDSADQLANRMLKILELLE